MSDKPREFWVVEESDRYPAWPHDAYDERPFEGAIHVIEYAAYEKLKAENERLREAAKVMREALAHIQLHSEKWTQLILEALAKVDEIRGKE